MEICFSAPSKKLVVFRNVDNFYSWSGDYDGLPIVAVIPLKGARRCVLLLDHGAKSVSNFRNLLCIDQAGEPVWVAKLPSTTDTFKRVWEEDDIIKANTWDGFLVRLDKNTGVQLEIKFVK
jgi:outer membrane protein assembly factor BamB